MVDIKHILERNKLSENSVYLLELIPLIEMIWADGNNQEQEIHLLQQFTTQHIANLSKDAEGIEVVSVDEANEFINHFMDERPDPELINNLKSLAVERMKGKGRPEVIDSVIDYCMDIAAACVNHYPYQPSERVRAEEKSLLKGLISSLHLREGI